MKRAILPSVLAVALSGLGAGVAQADAPERAIEGPSRLCFMYSRFHLAAGERVTDMSGGIHHVTLDVTGPSGRYRISEGNIFATPRRFGPVVYETPTGRVHRVRSKGAVRYALVGLADFSPDAPRVLVWLSGPALTDPRDKGIFPRLEVGEPAEGKCDRRIVYGGIFED